MRRMVVLGMVGLLLVAASAAAEPQELFSDPCGMDGLLEDGPDTSAWPYDPAVPPWYDLCEGTVEVMAFRDEVDGGVTPAHLRFTVDVGAPFDERPAPAQVNVSFAVGACSLDIRLADEQMGADELVPLLRSRCEAPAPCDPDSVPEIVNDVYRELTGEELWYCSKFSDPELTHIPAEAVSVDGNRITIDLVFDGALERFSPLFVDGAALRHPTAYTWYYTDAEATGVVAYPADGANGATVVLSGA